MLLALLLLLTSTVSGAQGDGAPPSPAEITPSVPGQAHPRLVAAPLAGNAETLRPRPGELARVDLGTADTAARAITAADAYIVPKAGLTVKPRPYLMPREGAVYSARRIWAQKQQEARQEGFDWRRAIEQSGMLLAMSQAYRIADQPETRAELKGPFFKDWLNSVRGLHGWGDTDGWLANYVAHPMEGAVAGYIQIQNDPKGRLQEFGKSKEYWKSRMKAAGWATLYSTFYELSPVGDAGIGNVGHIERNPGTKGAVDLVITPTLGLSLLVLEDVLDRYVVWPIERRTNNTMAKRLLRSFIYMHHSFTNLFRFKLPWYIDSRGPVNQPAIRYSQLPR